MGTPVPASDLPSGTAVPDDDLSDSAPSVPAKDAYGMPGGDISAGQLFGDVGKTVIGGIVHGAGNLADVFTGTAPGPESHASRWSAPFAVTDRLGQLDPDQALVHQAVNNGYDRAFGTGPAAQTIKERIPQATEAIGTVMGLGGLADGLTAAAPTESAEDIVARQAQSSAQSTSAAAAAPRLGQTSPELRQAIVSAAQRNGGAVNPDALVRHVEADSLPVPVKLTEGQALQDPIRISAEQNMRGQADGALAMRFNEQNAALAQNMYALRDEVGPDVFTTNPVEHGDTLIKAYQDKAAAADADIDAKYQALRDANGGKFPVDVKQLTENVENALHQDLLYEHAPKELGQLQSLAESGNMTFEQFEAMRTNLARTMRSSSNGNEVAAARVIRQQMEKLPMAGDASSLKPLADAARSAARKQFQTVEADPAYSAALSGKVPPDTFVRKFVTGGNRDDVATMQKNLSDNPVALQTMGVSTVDHLRRAAGIDDMGNGNFSQAGFNKQLQALAPKIKTLVGPKVADTLEQVGNVARYTQAQPRGSFVNNSNTLVGSLADHGGGLLEHAVNAKTGGIGGTIARGMLKGRATNAAIQRSLAPGAGLDQLQ